MKILKIKSTKIITSLILAVFVLLAIPYATTATNTYHSMHYGVFSVMAYSFSAFVIYKSLYLLKDKRLIITSLILGFMFSSMLIIGKLILVYAQNVSKKSVLLAIIGLTFLFASLIAIIINYLPKLKYALYNNFIQNKFSKFFDKPTFKYFLIVWAIIFVCFIPALLATFPGLFSYDAPGQLMQYQTGTITAFHPPLHTLLIGLSFDLGQLLYSKSPDNAGMLVYSLIQMSIMSAIFAYCCYFLAKIKIPIILQILSIIFFGLFPVNQIFAVCATKDIIFAGLMLLVLIFVLEAIMDTKKFFNSYFLQIRLIIFIVLACLFRNNEIYAFLLCIPFLLLVFRKYLFKISAICLICLICYFSITGPVYKAFNIGKGDVKEALAVPIQQISTVVHIDGKISEDEKSAIEACLGNIDNIKNEYLYNISDPEKSHFNNINFNKNKFYYLKQYINVGLKNKRIYLKAFLSLITPYIYPDYVYYPKALPINYIMVNNTDWPGCTHIERHSLLQISDYFDKIGNFDNYQKYPVVSIFFSQGFYVWFMLFAIAICIYKKKYSITLPMLFLLTLWFSFLFGPVALTRYAYPLFVSFPLMVAIILQSTKSLVKLD